MQSKTKEINKKCKPENGAECDFDGKSCVYYDGYWIKSYHVDNNSLADKKMLIDQLTRRVFHHCEQGINTPSCRLDEIRAVYEKEAEPAKKRVKGAMLAGALLNRGRDILTVIVELEEAGVSIESGNELLRECGRCFMGALELGKNIKLADGGEGVDELWGEPFRVFSMPFEDFFRSRYIKVAKAMSEIDEVANSISILIKHYLVSNKLEVQLTEFRKATKLACETIRNDPTIFHVWPRYIAAKESYENYVHNELSEDIIMEHPDASRAYILFQEGGKLLVKLATLRVPIPNSVNKFKQYCNMLTKKD